MINLSSKYIKPLRIHSRALKHHLINIWVYHKYHKQKDISNTLIIHDIKEIVLCHFVLEHTLKYWKY